MKNKILLLLKKISIIFFFFCLLFSLNFEFQLPYFGTRAIYYCDLLVLISCILILFDLKKILQNKFQKKYLIVCLIFSCYLIFSFIFRVKLYYLQYTYFLILQLLFVNIYLILIITILIKNKIIVKKDFEIIIYLFLLFVNAFQFYYYLKYNDIRPSPMLENINIYSCMMILSVPFLVLNYFKNNKYFKYFSLFLFFLIVFLAFYTGSRSYLFFLMIALFISILIVNKKLFLKTIILCTILFTLSFGVINVVNKLKPTLLSPSIQRTFSLNWIVEKFKPTDGIYSTTNESDMMRKSLAISAINEIKENPLIGTGKYYLEVSMFGSIIMQPPHNIILEWLILVGFIGLPMYIYLFFYPLFSFLKFCKNRNYLLALSTYFLFFIYSLLQPTSIIIMILNYLVILVYFYFYDFILKEN